MSATRIAVLGHCAAGKSTVVDQLVERGLDAYSVAQEHSIVHDLWAHLQPDVVVVLEVSLEEIRARKANPDWPEWIYETQDQRLKHARENADVVIDTDRLPVESVVAEIVRAVDSATRS